MNERLTASILLIIASTVLFFRLGHSPLESWDEAIYAESAKEMLRGGDWITLHWNGQPFFQKPPLLIWSTALLFKLFGISETAARAASALSGVGCVLLTFLLARMFAGPLESAVAGLILLFSRQFAYSARFGTMDVMLTLFMLLALYAYLQTEKDNRWWLVVGAASGLSVLTKGAAAFPLVLVLGAMVLWRKRQHSKSRSFWLGVALCVVIGGTWHVLMVYLHGQPFLQEYLGYQTIERIARSVDQQPEDRLYYARYLITGLLPFSLFLPGAIWVRLKDRRIPIILPIFGALVFFLYFFTATQHSWYIVPVFPVMALLLTPTSKKALPLYLVGLIVAASLMERGAEFHRPLSDLSKRARMDAGTIAFYPRMNFGPEVLFYSDRELCADVHDTSMGRLAKCSEPPDNVIVLRAYISKLHGFTEITSEGEFVYGTISQPPLRRCVLRSNLQWTAKAIVGPQSGIARELERTGWSEKYRDEQSVVFSGYDPADGNLTQ